MKSFLMGIWQTFCIFILNAILTPLMLFCILIHVLSAFMMPWFMKAIGYLVYGKDTIQFNIHKQAFMNIITGIINVWFLNVFFLLKEPPEDKNLYLTGSSLSIISLIIAVGILF